MNTPFVIPGTLPQESEMVSKVTENLMAQYYSEDEPEPSLMTEIAATLVEASWRSLTSKPLTMIRTMMNMRMRKA